MSDKERDTESSTNLTIILLLIVAPVLWPGLLIGSIGWQFLKKLPVSRWWIALGLSLSTAGLAFVVFLFLGPIRTFEHAMGGLVELAAMLLQLPHTFHPAALLNHTLWLWLASALLSPGFALLFFLYYLFQQPLQEQLLSQVGREHKQRERQSRRAAHRLDKLAKQSRIPDKIEQQAVLGLFIPEEDT